MRRLGIAVSCGICLVTMVASVSAQEAYVFSTNGVDGRMAGASRQSSAGKIETETADDFLLTQQTSISSATFTGLITGASASDISEVGVEIYRVFPTDSQNPPSGRVPTRINSPSDTAHDSRDSAFSTLTFQVATLAGAFTASNSVLNGINPVPNQRTGGDGAVTGIEVQFTVNFATPFNLSADHYFFVPQVSVNGGDFYWLSTAHPIASPGTPFSPDYQAWIRNANLAPDWLRIGTDIVGGSTPPEYNMVFSLNGQVVPEPATMLLLISGVLAVLRARRVAD